MTGRTESLEVAVGVATVGVDVMNRKTSSASAPDTDTPVAVEYSCPRVSTPAAFVEIWPL